MAFTSTQSPLARLHQILTMLDYPAHLMQIDPQTPFEQVLVVLEPDLPPDVEPRYVMQIFFAEDVLKASGLPELQNAPENSATLQFMIELPIDCSNLSTERLLATYEAINLFTQIIPLGNLGINNDKKIYFRYSLFGESQNMNATLVAELLGMFSMFLNQLGPLLERFTTSDQSLTALMEETGLHKAFEGIKAPSA